MVDEAERLERELKAEHTAEKARKERVDAMLASLEGAARSHGEPKLPGPAWNGLRAVEGQAELAAEDAPFRARRVELYANALELGLERAQDAIAAADELAAAGDFDGMQTRLAELLPALTLPEPPEDLDSAELAQLDGRAELERLRLGLSARLANLDAERKRWRSEQARADVRLVAESLEGPEGLERELRTLALDAAGARLGHLAEALATAPLKGEIGRIARDLAAGERALESIAAEFAKDTGAASRCAIRATCACATPSVPIATGSRSRARVPSTSSPGPPSATAPWRSTSSSTSASTRDYTPEELAGIAEPRAHRGGGARGRRRAGDVRPRLAPRTSARARPQRMLEGFAAAGVGRGRQGARSSWRASVKPRRCSRRPCAP